MATMIRINLLPIRAVKKREHGRQVLALFGVVIVLAGVLNYLWYDSRNSVWDRNQRQINNLQGEIDKLKKDIGEVEGLKKRTKDVEDKLKVLGDLKKGRSGPVRLMDAFATVMPKKVWIRGFDEKNNSTNI